VNFLFSIPTAVHFGPGSAARLGEEVRRLGAGRVLLVHDRGVMAAGLIDPLLATLAAAGIDVSRYDDVPPNPSDHAVEATAAAARAGAVEAIVAVGGGSAIDAAKAANILLANPGPIAAYEGIDRVARPGLPLVALPTTAGTASEVTAFTIVTDTARHRKMVIGGCGIAPTVALADPLLTRTLPPALTAATGLDALTHAIEAYVSTAASPPADALALDAIRRIAVALPRAFADGADIAARSDMLLGSMMAGFAFNAAGLGLVHALAHPLGARFGLAHGTANAIALAPVMAYNSATAPGRYRAVAAALGVAVDDLDDDDAAQAAAARVAALVVALAIPSLGQCGVTPADLPQLVEDALTEPSIAFNPRRPVRDELLALLAGLI